MVDRFPSSKKNGVLRLFQNGSFSLPLLWEPSQAPGGKSHNLAGVPMSGSPWGFYLVDVSTPNLQQVINHSFSLPSPALVADVASAFESVLQ